MKINEKKQKGLSISIVKESVGETGDDWTVNHDFDKSVNTASKFESPIKAKQYITLGNRDFDFKEAMGSQESPSPTANKMFIPSPKKVDPMTSGMRRQLSNQNLKEQ